MSCLLVLLISFLSKNRSDDLNAVAIGSIKFYSMVTYGASFGWIILRFGFLGECRSFDVFMNDLVIES